VLSKKYSFPKIGAPKIWRPIGGCLYRLCQEPALNTNHYNVTTAFSGNQNLINYNSNKSY